MWDDVTIDHDKMGGLTDRASAEVSPEPVGELTSITRPSGVSVEMMGMETVSDGT